MLPLYCYDEELFCKNSVFFMFCPYSTNMKIACKMRDDYSNLKNISAKASQVQSKNQSVTGPLAIKQGIYDLISDPISYQCLIEILMGT